jgi:enoyl-CoA hydratase/carnithine racemase
MLAVVMTPVSHRAGGAMAHVETRTEGHVLVIRINRPEKYNALSVAMYHELGRAFARLDTDPDLRVALLYAEGRNFTAGIELDEWAPIFGSGMSFPRAEDEIDPMGITGPQHTKPVVIAVQGYCFTWGVEILLNSEIRVASRDAQFQMLEVQRGIYPCGGATLRLPREIGWGNAQRVLLTGERWSAEQALQWGMVQEVVEPGQQVTRAMDIARTVADAAPLGVRGCLKATRFALEHDRDESVAQMMRDLVPVMNSEDAAEGVRSFLERRKAVFSGR